MSRPLARTTTPHVSRRSVLAALAGAGGLGAAAPLLAGCGSTGQEHPVGQEGRVEQTGYVASRQHRTAGSPAQAAASAAALGDFSADLFARIAATGGNTVCSPYSVAVALAMTAAGARGGTAEQIDSVLHAGPGYAAGLGRLDEEIRARARRDQVDLQTASSLWGQRGTTWRPAFLDALAADLGTGMHVVDFVEHADAARAAINDWTAVRTAGRIQDLLAPGVLDPTTRLVLVDAIHLEATWADPFDVADTHPGAFTRSDSSSVRVPMMAATLPGAGFASGRGWRAARVPYADDGGLAMAVVVPEAGHAIGDVEQAIAGTGLARLLAGFSATPVELRLPRWTTRTSVSLSGALRAMGMPLAFSRAADFSGMTTDEALKIDAVEHQAWIAVDEAGTEAAAATAVGLAPLSVRVPVQGQPVYADRPFVHVVYDQATRTPLFVGRVEDPSV